MCVPLESLHEPIAHELITGDGRYWTSAGDARVAAEPDVHAAVFSTEILEAPSATGVSLTALADLVLSMNSRFRLVWITLAGGRLALESVVLWPDLTPILVEELVAALGSSASAVKQPCRALLVPQVAREYLQFHHPAALAETVSRSLNPSLT
jgi:hypothetical protein